MSHQFTLTNHPALEEVMEKFEKWRMHKMHREPIPLELWEAASALTKDYSISHISSKLQLNYTDFNDRVNVLNPDAFIEDDDTPIKLWEIGFEDEEHEVVSAECTMDRAEASECTVEMENKFGAKMRMSFKGETNFDLLELAKSFWSHSV